MTPKIKTKNSILKLITSKNTRGITLAPFGIYLREDVFLSNNKKTINHELIHWQQQMELLIIFFYLLYFVEWFIRLFINNNPYRSMSFEREAFTNDSNLDYLKNRKPFNWIRFICKPKSLIDS